MDRVKLPNGGLAHFRISAEAPEIVLAAELNGRDLHRSGVQRSPVLVDVLSVEYVAGFILSDPVQVDFSGRVEAAVKARRCLGDGEDADIVREIFVDIIPYLVRCLLGLDPELSDLTFCVDACVGAAGPVDIHGLPGHDPEDLFQLLLDGIVGIALFLPAVVAGAIVLDEHSIILHNCILSVFRG